MAVIPEDDEPGSPTQHGTSEGIGALGITDNSTTSQPCTPDTSPYSRTTIQEINAAQNVSAVQEDARAQS